MTLRTTTHHGRTVDHGGISTNPETNPGWRNGEQAQLIREVDRSYRAWCRRRGLDPWDFKSEHEAMALDGVARKKAKESGRE